MGSLEEVLPVSVVAKLAQFLEQFDHATFVVLQAAPAPKIAFVHPQKPQWANVGSSLAVFSELTAFSETQIMQLLNATPPASAEIRNSKCAIVAEQVNASGDRYAVLAILDRCVGESAEVDLGERHESLSCKTEDSGVSHSAVLSAATANWTSSLVHAMCQPTHVTQNVADLIEMKFDAGLITGDPLPRYLEMLRLATAQATEQLEAVKQQFGEYSDTPEKIDLAEAVRETFGVDNCRLSPDGLPIYVTCDAARLRLLLGSLRAVASGEVSSEGSASGSADMSVSVDVDETVHRFRVGFANGIPYSANVLKAKGDEILPSSILRACGSIAEGCLAEFSLLTLVRGEGKSSGESLQPVADSAASVRVDAAEVVFPATYEPPEYRMSRSVRYIW